MARRLLTENQQHHLQVSFGTLLAEAVDLQAWVGGVSPTENPWAEELVVQLEQLTRSLRAAAVRLDLDVQRREASPERRVASWASVWWAQILDCRPKSLRAYGVVEPELERELTPVVDEIAARLLRVRSLVAHGS